MKTIVSNDKISDLPGSNRRPQDDQLSVTVSRSSNWAKVGQLLFDMDDNE